MTARSPKPKSEKRQRTDRLFVRLTPEEKAAFLNRADKAGMASAAFARAVLAGDAGPRAQRRIPADGQALRQIIGHLGKTGSNLNQIARYLHTGGSAEVVLQDIRFALAEQARIRDMLYAALGKDPDHAKPAPLQPPPAAHKAASVSPRMMSTPPPRAESAPPPPDP